MAGGRIDANFAVCPWLQKRSHNGPQPQLYTSCRTTCYYYDLLLVITPTLNTKTFLANKTRSHNNNNTFNDNNII